MSLSCVVALTVPVATSSAVRAPELCQGRPVTVLADHSFTRFSGTEQADVIAVVARGVQLQALGGDDLVCVRAGNATVDAGGGDDVVVADAPDYSTVLLGPGRDRFEGGDERDTVFGGDEESDSDRDQIFTGSSYDVVSSGSPGQVNDDEIDTGPDLDAVTLAPLSPAGRLDLGGGPGSMAVLLSPATVTATVDVGSRVVSTDGDAFTWSGSVQSLSLVGHGAGPESARFEGTSRGEVFSLIGMPSAVLTVRAAGGDDALNLADDLAGGSSVDMGAGRRDRCGCTRSSGEAAPASTPRLDLAGGRSTSARPGPRPPSSAPRSPS